MVVIKQSGDFKKMDKFLKKMSNSEWLKFLSVYGRRGVEALASATPKDSGITADGWGYEVSKTGNKFTISWTNNNENKGVNIAVILQFGHGTGTGGWVEGRDYINPAIRPIFDDIVEAAWKEVQNA